WLSAYLGSNQRIVSRTVPTNTRSQIREFFKILGSPILKLTKTIIDSINPPTNPSPWPEVPVSDGFYESLGCDVIHFPFQYFVLCAIPSIFNPHDLQHLHFPK